MKISYDSTALIADVKEDIELFGDCFRVYAVYALRIVDGIEFEYISDYVDAEKPQSEEADIEVEYDQLMAEYALNIESLKKTKHHLMTLSDLLKLLEEQDSII